MLDCRGSSVAPPTGIFPVYKPGPRSFFAGLHFVPAEDMLVNGETSLVRVFEYGGSLGRGLEAKKLIPAETRIFGAQSTIWQIRMDQLSRVLADGSPNLSANPDLLFPNAACVGIRADTPGWLYLDPPKESPLRYLNHSCEPNVGRLGPYSFMAMREIAPGEAVTTDYALLEVDPDWKMSCACGVADCRQQISGVLSLSLQLAKEYWAWLPKFMRELYLANLSAETRSSFAAAVAGLERDVF